MVVMMMMMAVVVVMVTSSSQPTTGFLARSGTMGTSCGASFSSSSSSLSVESLAWILVKYWYDPTATVSCAMHHTATATASCSARHGEMPGLGVTLSSGVREIES